MQCLNWACGEVYQYDDNPNNLKKTCKHHPGKYDIGSIHVILTRLTERDYGLKAGAAAENCGPKRAAQPGTTKESLKINLKKSASTPVFSMI